MKPPNFSTTFLKKLQLYGFVLLLAVRDRQYIPLPIFKFEYFLIYLCNLFFFPKQIITPRFNYKAKSSDYLIWSLWSINHKHKLIIFIT